MPQKSQKFWTIFNPPVHASAALPAYRKEASTGGPRAFSLLEE
jgi:hypothetical protein